MKHRRSCADPASAPKYRVGDRVRTRLRGRLSQYPFTVVDVFGHDPSVGREVLYEIRDPAYLRFLMRESRLVPEGHT